MNSYVFRLMLSGLFTFLSRAGSAQQLYVFSVIGPTEQFRADRERLGRLADSLAFYGGYRQTRYDFSTRRAFTAQSVRKTITAFRPQNPDEDIVWFHYAGRGYGSKPGAWPTLRMGKQRLAVREVLALLRSKPTRTLLVTIDCANQPEQTSLSDTVLSRKPVSGAFDTAVTVKPQRIGFGTTRYADSVLTDRYHRLVKPPQVRQIIIMAAASHGQRAYRTNERGSVWLANFSRVIHDATRHTTQTTSWKQLQEQLSQLTQQKTSNRQTPQYNRQTITCCETDSLR